MADPAEILTRLAAGVPTADDLDALSAAATAVLGGAEPTLDHALGLAGGPGKRKAVTLLALRQRNAIIRRLADTLVPGAPTLHQALAVQQAARRYAATAWRAEQHQAACPHPAGSSRALLWEAHKAHNYFPLSLSTLQEIISGISD